MQFFFNQMCINRYICIPNVSIPPSLSATRPSFHNSQPLYFNEVGFSLEEKMVGETFLPRG